MKIFLDTAHLEEIKKWVPTGLIDGVTTNPSHLSKENSNPQQLIHEICALLPHGEISVEVTEKDPESLYVQAKKIASLSPNIVVKVPCHPAYYQTINRLIKEGIRLNITLVFSLTQGLMMSKLGATMISPFVGRLEDNQLDGIGLLHELREMIDVNGYETQILAASLRTVDHFNEAIMSGADIVTLPVKVFKDSLGHSLTDQGIEKFDADWQKLAISQFP